MATLVPVNHNPFETQTSTAKLTPVDYNPFEQAPRENEIPDRHANFQIPEHPIASYPSDVADFAKMVAQKGVDYVKNEGPDLLKEGAKSFSRGFNTVIPQQTGKAMQFLKRFSDEMLTPEGFENPIQDYARKLLQGAGQAVEGFGDTQQKRLEPASRYIAFVIVNYAPQVIFNGNTHWLCSGVDDRNNGEIRIIFCIN